MLNKRSDNRAYNQIRKLKLTYDTFGYASGSVLLELGKTKVLCSVTLQPSVPSFLKGKKRGWLTAEYAMLPTATKQRTQRSASVAKPNGRSLEISRLIGRSLRTIVDLSTLGERTLIIDCDVLQADGGTRTAAITGAYVALKQAQNRWLGSGLIKEPFLTDAIAAISVGMRENQGLLDIDFAEDSAIDCDFNFVLTASGNIIEIQGTAEQVSLSWDQFQQVKDLAIEGVNQLFDQTLQHSSSKSDQAKKRAPLFSMANRFNTQP